MGGAERIKLRGDLGKLREREHEFEDATTETRPLVPACAVAWLVVTCNELRQMPLTNVDGFVLSLVDGRSTVEMIIDIAGLKSDETIGVLAKLVGLGAIELQIPPDR
jgi:hypothetical protein